MEKLPPDTLREIVAFGDKMGIKHYVSVTTASIKRMMRRDGFAVTHFEPPMRIGLENAGALNFEIGEQTQVTLFGKMLKAT